MPYWLQVLLALVALAVLGPLMAWIGKRHGRRMKGGVVLASFMLGVGEPSEPPPKHRVESAGPGKDACAPGDPPLND